MKRALIACVLLAGACQPQAPKAVEPTPEQAAAPAAPQLAADEIPAEADAIVVTSPASGARVKSPLVVEGRVDSGYMFEGSFPVALEVDGQQLIAMPGEQQAPDDWTKDNPVRFKATVEFEVAKQTNAVLVLKEDMPQPKSADSDEPGPARTLRIPVVLVPGS